MSATTRLSPTGTSRAANASYAGKTPAPSVSVTFRRTLSTLGTRAGDRQVQANHNG